MTTIMLGIDILPRLKAGIPTPVSLMKPCGSAGSRFTGVRVATGLRQSPSYVASTGV